MQFETGKWRPMTPAQQDFFGQRAEYMGNLIFGQTANSVGLYADGAQTMTAMIGTGSFNIREWPSPYDEDVFCAFVMPEGLLSRQREKHFVTVYREPQKLTVEGISLPRQGGRGYYGKHIRERPQSQDEHTQVYRDFVLAARAARNNIESLSVQPESQEGNDRPRNKEGDLAG